MQYSRKKETSDTRITIRVSQFKLALSLPSSSNTPSNTIKQSLQVLLLLSYTFNQREAWKQARSLADCSPVSVNRVTVYTERKEERKEEWRGGAESAKLFGIISFLPTGGKTRGWEGRCIPRSPAKNPIWLSGPMTRLKAAGISKLGHPVSN